MDLNWGFLHAFASAKQSKTTLTVTCVLPNYLSERTYKFVKEGIDEFIEELLKLKVNVVVTTENRFVVTRHTQPQTFFIDFHPLKTIALITGHQHIHFLNEAFREEKAKTFTSLLPGNIICVDSSNVIPAWQHRTQYYQARNFRLNIKDTWVADLQQEVRSFSTFVYYESSSTQDLLQLMSQHDTSTDNTFTGTYKDKKNIRVMDEVVRNKNIPASSMWTGGFKEGMKRLDEFLRHIDTYPKTKSCLSPYITHGHISPLRIVMKATHLPLKESFLDQIFVRRELSENYCMFGSTHDFSTCGRGIQQNIADRSRDQRMVLLSVDSLDAGHSPDPMWNAIQRKLVKTGFLTGGQRMYWAKQMLKWLPSAHDAFRVTLYLNDKYQLDGNCPNGIVNILWCLVGLHDKPFMRTPIYGFVRTMKKLRPEDVPIEYL